MPEDRPRSLGFNQMKQQNKSYAVMAQRHSDPNESRDFFPTPMWATRALMEHVITDHASISQQTVWEPAAGQGHMARVLSCYFGKTIASDAYDYNYGSVIDFTAPNTNLREIDWVITNPPFKLGAEFILKRLEVADKGVAMLTRTVFIEGKKRYKRIFSQTPPTIIAQFAERVPMVEGRVDRYAVSATAYAWLVWEKEKLGTSRVMWIPPCRKELEKDIDYKWGTP